MADFYLNSKRIALVYAFFATFIIFFISGQAHMAYAYPIKKGAVQQETGYTLKLKPQETKIISLTFKNNGSKQWKGTKGAPLLLISNAQRESYLYESSWYSKVAPLQIVKIIKSKKTFTVSFPIEAPLARGEYQEQFSLFLGTTKLSTSHITVSVRTDEKMQAVKKEQPKVQLASLNAVPTPSPQPLSGTALLQSAQSLSLKPFEKIEFRVGFRNNGTVEWKKNGQHVVTLRSSAKNESYFYDQSWYSGTIVSQLQQDALSGWVSYFTFILQAPEQPGEYTENISLYYDEEKISESELRIPITVIVIPIVLVSPAHNVNPDVVTPMPTPLLVQGVIQDKIEQEPTIRVGYFHTRNSISITAQKPYEIRTEKGDLFAALQAGEISTVTFDFSTLQYTLSTPQATSTTPYYLKFGPQQIGTEPTQDNDLIFEITSYQNRPGWTTAINDNKVRNRVEVRYAPKTDRLWLINELTFESYLKGIAETSNNSAQEFQKTLIVAARTFGKYHIERGTKHAGDNVTVFATDADQIYRGYNAEIRLPNVTKAVDDTRGVMVFYNNSLAITPYYSQSDGRTRSWSEVWGGDPKPWLIGKDDPCCKNLPMLGHGVGMSARGAVQMALEGKTFEEILKYYYTGIELRKRY